MLLDEKPVRLAKAENYQAIHLMVPRRGVAVHINAFNFPSWGLWEKAAVSLLAGIPVFAKPASATAMLAHEMVRDVVEAKVLPDGALSLLVGSAGDLLDHLTSDDVVAFTGSADTAARVRGHRNVVARSVPVNIEADSINAALLAPDAAGGGAAFDAFVREVVREMTVKAGQKCTAIRRIFVPADKAGDVAEALFAKLKTTKVGDPRNEETRMGPLVTRAQQAAAFDGIRKLASEAEFVIGGAEPPALDGIDASKAAFVAPTLLRVRDARDADAVHEVEVFGPAATVVPYKDEKDACTQVARGGGSLVASIYGEDQGFLARMVERDRREPRPAAGGRSVDRRRRTPVMASSCRNAITAGPAAPAPARSSAASTACASITSGWRCRVRPICSRACRRRPRRCIDRRR